MNNNRIDKDTVKLTAVHVAISHTKETCMVTNEGEREREGGRGEGGREGEREREREGGREGGRERKKKRE